MIRLKPQDLRGKDVGVAYEFPELTGDLISLANHLSKATTRKKLGNPTSVIEGFNGKTFEDWERFYEQERPGALDTASQEIYSAIEKLRSALKRVDKALIRLGGGSRSETHLCRLAHPGNHSQAHRKTSGQDLPASR